jgi:hypothetical protein
MGAMKRATLFSPRDTCVASVAQNETMAHEQWNDGRYG